MFRLKQIRAVVPNAKRTIFRVFPQICFKDLRNVFIFLLRLCVCCRNNGKRGVAEDRNGDFHIPLALLWPLRSRVRAKDSCRSEQGLCSCQVRPTRPVAVLSGECCACNRRLGSKGGKRGCGEEREIVAAMLTRHLAITRQRCRTNRFEWLNICYSCTQNFEPVFWKKQIYFPSPFAQLGLVLPLFQSRDEHINWFYCHKLRRHIFWPTKACGQVRR